VAREPKEEGQKGGREGRRRKEGKKKTCLHLDTGMRGRGLRGRLHDELLFCQQVRGILPSDGYS